MPAISALIALNSSLKSVLSYRYFFTLGATFTAFLKLILDNPFQTRMVAKFYKDFIHSFFSLRLFLGGFISYMLIAYAPEIQDNQTIMRFLRKYF
jgi:hypothetical protein